MMLISFIIPVYNGSLFIKQCIETLLAQTYNNWEGIFINDGSTDNTRELLEQVSRADSRIKFYNQKKQGAAIARYTGVKLATGEYITFLDVDDTLSKDFLQSLIQQITPSIDIVVCPFNIIKKKKIISKHITPGIFNRIDYLKKILTGYAGWELCAKIFRKELFEQPLIQPQNIRIGEDAANLIQLISRAKKIKITNIPLYNYIQYSTSASHIKSKQYAEETLKAGYFIKSLLEQKTFYLSIKDEIGAMFLLFYSNSTRKANLSLKHPMVYDIYKSYYSYRIVKLIPLQKRIYITISFIIERILSYIKL